MAFDSVLNGFPVWPQTKNNKVCKYGFKMAYLRGSTLPELAVHKCKLNRARSWGPMCGHNIFNPYEIKNSKKIRSKIHKQTLLYSRTKSWTEFYSCPPMAMYRSYENSKTRSKIHKKTLLIDLLQD